MPPQKIFLCSSRMLVLSILSFQEETRLQLPFHFILEYVSKFELLYCGSKGLIYPFSFANIALCRGQFYSGLGYQNKAQAATQTQFGSDMMEHHQLDYLHYLLVSKILSFVKHGQIDLGQTVQRKLVFFPLSLQLLGRASIQFQIIYAPPII